MGQEHICQCCGVTIPSGGLFYRCRMEIISGFDIYIAEYEEDADKLIEEACREMAGRSPEELMNEVYEEISFLACPACRSKIRQQLLALLKKKSMPAKIILFPPKP